MDCNVCPLYSFLPLYFSKCGYRSLTCGQVSEHPQSHTFFLSRHFSSQWMRLWHSVYGGRPLSCDLWYRPATQTVGLLLWPQFTSELGDVCPAAHVCVRSPIASELCVCYKMSCIIFMLALLFIQFCSIGLHYFLSACGQNRLTIPCLSCWCFSTFF